MLKDNLVPVEYCGPMNSGNSLPQLIKLSDGKKYVVKFKNNPHGTRTLVNEYVVTQLAEHLSLPVVPFQVVHISNSFIRKNGLHKYGLSPGSQFASLYLSNCYTLESSSPSKVINSITLPGIIAFDQWVSNVDRSKTNFLFQELPDGNIKVYIIDHEKCFPGWWEWTTETLQSSSLSLQIKNVHIWCAQFIPSKKNFMPYLDKILSVSGDTVARIVNSVPSDWGVADHERKALIRYLLEAKKSVPGLVAEFTKSVGIL